MSDNVFAGTDLLDNLYGDEEFSAEDLTAKTSRSVDKAGWYHGHVLAVKGVDPDHEGIFSVVRVDIQILAGDHPDQKDAMYYHRVRLFKLKKDEKDKSKIIGREPYSREYVAQQLKTAVGLGLIALESGAKLSQVNWDNAIGAQTIFRIDADKDTYEKEGEKKERTRYEVGFGNFFRPDDPQVDKVPKDAEALAILTGGEGIGGGSLSDI